MHPTKSLSYSDIVNITYLQSSLVAVIVGGNRMSGYSQTLELKTNIYDPDNKDNPQGRL